MLCKMKPKRCEENPKAAADVLILTRINPLMKAE